MFTIKSILLLALFFTGVNAAAIPAASSDSFWLSVIPRSTDPDTESIERDVQSPLNETTNAAANANANGLAGVPPAPSVANAHPVDATAGAAAGTDPSNATVANGTVHQAPPSLQAPLHFLNNEQNKLIGGPSGETPNCQSECQPLWVDVVNLCNRDIHCTCNNTVAEQLQSCYNCDLRERQANWMSVFAIQRTFNAYTAQCRKIGQPINFLRASALPPPKSAASTTSVKLVSVVASVAAALAFMVMA